MHTLERIADRVPVTNRFPAHADFTTAPESRHLYDEYPSVRGKTLFLPKDRLYLTSKIMDEHFDFGVLVEHKVVEQCLALHDANAGESLTLEWFSDHWVLFWRSGPRDCGAPRVSMPQIDKGEACQYWERPWRSRSWRSARTSGNRWRCTSPGSGILWLFLDHTNNRVDGGGHLRVRHRPIS